MIIPAFDLINGKAVRLYQGNYSYQKNYNINLYTCLEEYKLQGVKNVHLVDLDGAKNTKNRQISLFRKILFDSPISIQIGGGIRNEKDIDMLFNMGAKKIVIGSAVIEKKCLVKKCLDTYGSNAIVLALDVNINNDNEKFISIHGWQKQTQVTLEETIEYFLPYGLKHVLCTDISRDGTLSGPNIGLYVEISKKYFNKIEFQASGGIKALEDIVSLKNSGVKSVIIGRALLEKKFTIEEALKCWQNA